VAWVSKKIVIMKDKKINYQYNKERIDKQFFIDKKGIVHKYKGSMYAEITSMHYHIAQKLFPKIVYPKSPDDYVMSLGWILVGSSVYHCPIIHKKPTDLQIKTLKDLDLFDYLCFLYTSKRDGSKSYPKYKEYGVLCE
jgi:hypothetical protein